MYDILELYLVVNEIILCLIMFIYFWEGVESKNLRFRWFSKNLMLFLAQNRIHSDNP